MSQKQENPSKETAVDQKPGTSRRAALKKIAVGTGIAASAAALPDKWAKPIVDKVLVPAHAQTSPPGPPRDPCGGEPGVVTHTIEDGWEVPDCIVDDQIEFVAYGAAGEAGGEWAPSKATSGFFRPLAAGGAGGAGGTATATVIVTAGTSIGVTKGTVDGGGAGSPGPSTGYGPPGGAGGGATMVTIGGDILVAGGGGGGGGGKPDAAGGDGGDGGDSTAGSNGSGGTAGGATGGGAGLSPGGGSHPHGTAGTGGDGGGGGCGTANHSGAGGGGGDGNGTGIFGGATFGQGGNTGPGKVEVTYTIT